MTDWKARATSAEAAVSCIASGMRVFVHGAAATPTALVDALSRRTDLADVTLYHLHTTGPAPVAAPEHEGRFFSISLFAAAPVREAIADGRADYVPIFLSDIALPSTAASGRVSRIVPMLNPGAGVVTTRGHVHWVVTEYGAVDLFGKLRERAEGCCGASGKIRRR
jgi:4-hydroxybutyrate CoA-transferase